MVDERLVNYLKEGLARGFELSLLKNKLIEANFPRSDVEQAASLLKEKVSISPVFEEKMGIFKKIKKTLFSPRELFESTREEGVMPAFKFQLITLIFPVVLLSLVLFFLINSLLGVFSPFMNNVEALAGGITLSIAGIFAVSLFVFVPISTFIYSGVLHLFVKLYLGKGSYKETYKAIVYSSTPATILLFLPGINLLAYIWQFILYLQGMSIYHSISKFRAFLILLTPIVILVFIGGVISFFMPPSATLVASPNPAFEIYAEQTKCADGIIKVYVKNTGDVDISASDWAVHTIDKKNVDVWTGSGIGRNNWGMVIYTPNKYGEGLHIVEIGFSSDATKRTYVVC